MQLLYVQLYKAEIFIIHVKVKPQNNVNETTQPLHTTAAMQFANIIAQYNG